jgi:hypothetical protein
VWAAFLSFSFPYHSFLLFQQSVDRKFCRRHGTNARLSDKSECCVPLSLSDSFDGGDFMPPLILIFRSYTALGLVHSLDPLASGGVEPLEQKQRVEGGNTASSAVQTATTSKIRSSFGRIVRDADGNVVGVELAEDSMGGVEQDMSCLVPEMDGVVERRWVTEMGGADGVQREDARSSGVVQGKMLLLIWSPGAQSSPVVQFTQFEPREEKKTKNARFLCRNSAWLHSARESLQ